MNTLRRWWSGLTAKVVCHGIVYLFIAGAVLPIFWMVTSSFKTQRDVFTLPPRWINFSPTLDNYAFVLERYGVGSIINILLVTAGAVTIAVVVGCPAAYALARRPSKVTKVFGAVIFGTRILPTMTFILPMFLMFAVIGISGTRLALVVSYQLMLLPVVLYTMWSFFLSIPSEIEDAARIDGLGSVGVLFRVSLPIVGSGLAATIIMCVIFSWNQFLIGFVLGGRRARVPTMILQHFRSTEDQATAYGPMYAWATLVALPVVILALLTGSVLVRHLTGSKEGIVEDVGAA